MSSWMKEKTEVSEFVLYMNCQGYLNNKDELDKLLHHREPLFFCLSETHVDDSVIDSEMFVDGYAVVNCLSHSRRTGGVTIFVLQNLNFTVKLNESINGMIWIVALETLFKNKKYLLTVLYHPPGTADNLFVDYLNQFLHSVVDYDGTLLIVGDFNFDLLKKTYYSDKISNMIYSYGLNQLVGKPTCITQYSSTLTDYVISNERNLVCDVLLTPKISDHSIIIILIPVTDIQKQKKIKKLQQGLIFTW